MIKLAPICQKENDKLQITNLAPIFHKGNHKSIIWIENGTSDIANRALIFQKGE